jgi:signal transduction histidine kinase
MAAPLAWSLALASLVFGVADTLVTAACRPLFSEEAIAVHGWPFAPAATVGAAVMGAVIVSRYARHPIGWLLSVIGVLSSASLLAEAYSIWVLDADGPGPAAAGHVAGWASVLFGGQLALGLFAVVFLVAPNGRLLSRRWRLAVAAAVSGIILYAAGLLTLSPVEFTVTGNRTEGDPLAGILFSVGVLLIAGSMVAAVVAMIVRVRRVRGAERQQVRVILVSASAIAAGLVWLIVVQLFNGGKQDWLAAMPLFVAYDVLPICIAIAVLRFRLYDIDVIINRAVVLAVGTGFAAAGYVAVVVAVGAAVGSGAGGVWPSVTAMIVVALAFQPLRRRVVRLADRIAYGARAAPYEALADFSRRLGASPDPETLLPTVAEATGTAVLAQRVTVRLSVPDGTDRTAQWQVGPAPPIDGSDATEFDVADRGERLGSISVVMPPGGSLRPRDRELLAALADQAALAFRNNRLAAQLAGRVSMLDQQTAELAESRARIIAARDEERDRLAQAIRVGVAPYLEPTSRRLRRLAADVRDPDVERGLVAVLADAVTSLESLREISRGIMPQQLARSGLVAAMTAHLGQAGHVGAFVVDESVAQTRFDRSIETTAYFCLVEALRQLRRPIDVRLGLRDGWLTLRIGGAASGVGASTAWRDHLESLGGSASWTSEDGRAVVAISIPTEPATARLEASPFGRAVSPITR